jgi:hypothetical protein
MIRKEHQNDITQDTCNFVKKRKHNFEEDQKYAQVVLNGEVPNVFIDTNTGFKFKRVGKLAELLSQPDLMRHICSFIEFDVQLRLKMREINTIFYDFIEEFMLNCYVDMRIVSKVMLHFDLLGRRRLTSLLRAILPPDTVQQIFLYIPHDVVKSHMNWLVEQHADLLIICFAVYENEFSDQNQIQIAHSMMNSIPWNRMNHHSCITLMDLPIFPDPIDTSIFKNYKFQRLNLRTTYKYRNYSIETIFNRLEKLNVSIVDTWSGRNFMPFNGLKAERLLVESGFEYIIDPQYVRGLSEMKQLKKLVIMTNECDSFPCALRNADELKHLKICNLEVIVECSYHNKKWHHTPMIDKAN